MGYIIFYFLCRFAYLNIDQDTANYPVLDLVKGEGDELRGPLSVNVTEVGNQYCGTVNPFASKTRFPIRSMAIPDPLYANLSSKSAAPTSSVPLR